MPNPSTHHPPGADDRRTIPPTPHAAIAGVPVRDADIESTAGLHWIAKLFRVMSGLLGLLVVLQVFSGLTGAVEISYGVLAAEAIRLLIFAGLLWGAGDLADLFVKSHRDLRASRILLERLTHLAGQPPVHHGTPPVDEGDPRRGRGDATH